jgi:hypothetical protein
MMLEKTEAGEDVSPRKLIEPAPALLFKLTRILDHINKGANDKARDALADEDVATWFNGMHKIVLTP